MTRTLARGVSVAAAIPNASHASLYGFKTPPKGERAKCRRERVLELLQAHKGQWLTLYAIVEAVGGSQTGTSAKLRDLRKSQYGAYNVLSRKKPGTGNTWEYMLP
jgi:hypothetical protein